MPVLRALQEAGAANYVRRQVNDRDDLVRALTNWGQAQHKSYGLGYVAMHGSPGRVHIGRQAVDLASVANELPRRRLDSKILHFGSCSVLEDKRQRESLRKALGVRAVTGFTEDVDWFESLAFELILFDVMTYYKRTDAMEAYIHDNHRALAKRLGFVMERRR